MFGEQIQRQQPFLEVGRQALPELVESISGRGEVSQLPATRIQGSLIEEFLGDAPGQVRQDALANLEAVEQQRNVGRLQDLVNIGLGGVGRKQQAV